jgi:hypothetical protein
MRHLRVLPAQSELTQGAILVIVPIMVLLFKRNQRRTERVQIPNLISQ